MNYQNEIETGCFYYNFENILCTGNTPITKLIDQFLADSGSKFSEEIHFVSKNQLKPNKTKLSTPLYIYSKKRLRCNFLNYKNSFDEEITKKHGVKTIISYSIKANFNPFILKLFNEYGSWASLVNKNELLLALKCGLKGENLIFNGNGKKLSEIELAIRSSCYLNIDSLFNLNDTIEIAKNLKEESLTNSSLKEIFPVKLLLRINQTSTAQVHQYLNTSGQSCKFGINEKEIDSFIKIIKQQEGLIKLSGFHSHLGSTIKSLDIYNESVKNLIKLVNETIDKYKIETIEIINFGGGLGINYEKHSNRTSKIQKPIIEIPTPKDLALTIERHLSNLKSKNIIILVEPGRSLVGDSCILLTNLIGVKKTEAKNFLVIDGSMCECIRPCLYSAYHHIDYIKPLDGNFKSDLVDIVGPVCESGDFLGRDRYLQIPEDLNNTRDIYIAIMDVGAYCSSMSLNYNLHQKPAEICIDELEENDDLQVKILLTRKPDSFDDILSPYMDYL